MLFITHDLGVARKVSDRVMEINNGILKEKILR
jgi:ABC-type glutathione transport system ATPase component